MKNLIFKKRDANGNLTGEEEHLKMNDEQGNEQAIQVKDYMDTETYFQMITLEDQSQAKQLKLQGTLMMKKLIINPKINDKLINQLPWLTTMKIVRALRDEFMPEDSFLELGVALDTQLRE